MRRKNLLIDEYPLLVLPSLAQTIGLNEAIVLQQLHYWLENPKGGVDKDGHRWVYNTYENWQMDNFPFWSVRTVQRIFLNLESDGLVISMQDADYDRKKYYRIHYDKLAQWSVTECPPPSRQGGTMEDDNLAPSSLTETRKTETTQKKGDLVDATIRFHLSPKGIQDAIRDHFKLTPNWETKFNRQFMQWAVEAQVTPEQVKSAADLWRKDKRFNWAAPSLKGIQEHWLELIDPTPSGLPENKTNAVLQSWLARKQQEVSRG